MRSKEGEEDYCLTMPGLFNVENALAVIAAAKILHIPDSCIHSGLLRARSSGRMELYASKDKKIIAIVDYAHNKLSFEKLFSSIREEYPDYAIKQSLAVRERRPISAERIWGLLPDSTHRRCTCRGGSGYEPVEEISGDIAQYVQAQNCPYVMIEDRGEAIRTAIEESEDRTVILVTGKGNETRQKYGSEYITVRQM